HWYGIIIAAAVLIAAVLGARVARWLGEDPEDSWSMLLPVVIVSVIATRLYHVIHMWDFYSENPLLIPQIWNGGIGVRGGIAGGGFVIWCCSRARRFSRARWRDFFARCL